MRSHILTLLLFLCTAPAYASPATFVDGMRRGGFDRLSDEHIMSLGRWACDRNPGQAYDDAFQLFDRSASTATRAQLLAANLANLSNSELCPIVRLDQVQVVVSEGATFRNDSSVYGTPLFTAANQIQGRSTLKTGNWVYVRFVAANGRDRAGWVHQSEMRFDDD